MSYRRLGVDSEKGAVGALRNLVEATRRGFADVLDGWVAGEGMVLHIDGAGSKPIVAYLYYRETGDPSWFKGLMQDVLAMNVNDSAAVAARPELFADYLAYNSLLLDGHVLLPQLAEGMRGALDLLKSMGEAPRLAGGETAELPDQVSTLDVVGILLARANMKEVVDGSGIKPGHVIIGVRSGGRAVWEKRENSGIMCNGLTLARHVILSAEYRTIYPEAFPSHHQLGGRFRVDEYLDELEMTVGEALSSPTRFYSHIALEAARCGASGIVHVTGGGHMKILRLGEGLHYIVDSPPKPDPIFLLIQREGKISWHEMYKVFNMGVGLEIIAERSCADEVIEDAEREGMEAFIIGRVEKSEDGRNKVTIRTPWAGMLTYSRTF